MARAGRPVADEVAERDGLETALIEMVYLGIVVEEVCIRIRQAIWMTNMVEDVLEPAEGRLAEIKGSLALLQLELQRMWNEERNRRLG
jgi:hypothetical protein